MNLAQRSETSGGVKLTWGVTHRSGDGDLISRQASIVPPEVPKCLRASCLWKYLKDSLLFTLVASYHARRVAYAESHRHKSILERYRTGEPSPKTIWQAIYANLKLRCPVCRKYDVDPLLFRRKE